MNTYTLDELAESKDKEVAKIAKEMMKLDYPKTAQFEILLKQRIISYDIHGKEYKR